MKSRPHLFVGALSRGVDIMQWGEGLGLVCGEIPLHKAMNLRQKACLPGVGAVAYVVYVPGGGAVACVVYVPGGGAVVYVVCMPVGGMPTT